MAKRAVIEAFDNEGFLCTRVINLGPDEEEVLRIVAKELNKQSTQTKFWADRNTDILGNWGPRVGKEVAKKFYTMLPSPMDEYCFISSIESIRIFDVSNEEALC